ncbi:MAG: Prepilin peptidase [Clostridiales bacterium]|nr:Prepilin peptidase [Clostridiales bacterium]
MIELYFFVAVLGAVIGSFLNVCIYRIPKGQSIVNPPSHCSTCGTKLKALYLVPIFSYLFLRGRCRYCSNKISPRYMFIEILTSIIFLMSFWKYGISIEFAASVFLLSILIAVFFTDLDHKIIPNEFVLAGLAGGLLLFIYNLFYPVSFYGNRHWHSPLLGIAAGSGFLILVAIVGFIIYRSDDAMGMGDIKIMAPIGMFLGWKLSVIVLLTAVISGGLISAILLIFKVVNRKDTIPFGPFIVLGSLIALLWGWDFIYWYFSMVI